MDIQNDRSRTQKCDGGLAWNNSSQVAVLRKPLQGLLNRPVDRRLRQAERVHRLGAVVPFGHLADPDLAGRDHRRLPGDRGTDLEKVSQGQRDRIRQLEHRWLDARDLRNEPQIITHRDIPVAQEVSFADPAFLRREDVAAGHILDVDDVHAAVDVPGHLSLGHIDDHLPRRRRFDVVRPDNEGRVDDDRRQPPGDQDPRLVLGDILGHGIVVAGRPVVEGLVFGGRDGAARRDGVVGARVDDLLHADIERRLERRPRAADVDLVEQLGVRRPMGEIGGGEIERVAALDRPFHGIAVANVAVGPFDIQSVDVAGIARFPDQDLYILPVLDQRPCNGRSDESCRTRDKLFHAGLLALPSG